MDLSFWEKNTYFSEIDVLIIGSGIVGLNTARSIKEQKPSLKVVVVDRGFLPYGASTRNAGFACYGSLSELNDDLKKMSEEEVFGLVKRRWEGLKRLRSVLGDENIGYEALGGYEIFGADDPDLYKECNEQFAYFNEKLNAITGEKEMYVKADDRIKKFGFSGVEHLILNKGEGQIDTGKMMMSLLRYVRNLGVEVLNGINIEGWESTGDLVEIHCKEGFRFKVGNVIVTTNAFARELLPHLRVEPGRAQVLITEEIDDLKFKGAFHFEKGYYYFRNVGKRILFGGGRNLDFDKEQTTEFGLTEKVQRRLNEILTNVILPLRKVKVEQRWSGIMGLGPVKTTIIKKTEDHIFCAVRMGGMGIAIGSLVGEEAAELFFKEAL